LDILPSTAEKEKYQYIFQYVKKINSILEVFKKWTLCKNIIEPSDIIKKSPFEHLNKVEVSKKWTLCKNITEPIDIMK
jgi:hypothetical protein